MAGTAFGHNELLGFLAASACFVLFVLPISFVLLKNFFSWVMVDLLEFRFIPFRWRESNYGLLLLPRIAALFVWLVFWIYLGIIFLGPVLDYAKNLVSGISQ